jgi:hypothetical protein
MGHKSKIQGPFIERVHGNEISLMTEIVLEDITKDLFPRSKNTDKLRKKGSETQKNNDPKRRALHKKSNSMDHSIDSAILLNSNSTVNNSNSEETDAL